MTGLSASSWPSSTSTGGATAQAPDIRSGLWRLNIAVGEQGRGYGRFAAESVAAQIRRRGSTRMTTTWHPGVGGPESFYLRLGFQLTGETSGDQTVGELDLRIGLDPSDRRETS
ncbi:hypothetical protein GCM10009579_83430 [Streptomyces javensis]|uniref:GCN5-related N-acetyltransferase Rv2170-like domain-containing protein n=1 Tax=Streptomyces javensis TaxID=114698 RepID=A0ABP4I329_9ACTN